MVMNADGSGVRAVTDLPEGFTNLGSPEWSANGKTIAFDASRGGTTTAHIYLVNADGTNLRDAGLGCMPSFSPDGKRIVHTQPGHGIVIMDIDGTNRKDIARNGWGAQWSPDGKFIAWGRGGNIIVRNVKTKEEKPLLVGDQAGLFSYTYWNLGWSHDSRSIAFKARNIKTGGEDIVVADIDSPDGFKIMLSSSKSVHPDFTYSADNKRVLFAMTNPVDRNPRIYFIDREPQKVAPPQLLPGQPLDWKILNCAISPDGKQIAFTGEHIPQPVEWPIARK